MRDPTGERSKEGFFMDTQRSISAAERNIGEENIFLKFARKRVWKLGQVMIRGQSGPTKLKPSKLVKYLDANIMLTW